MVSCYLLDHSSQVSEAVIPVGYVMEGREILILDELDRPLTVGETGQISVRSRYLSPGFWHQPEATAAAFSTEDETSRLRSYKMGDLGKIAPDGLLHHLGRVDEMIKIRGQRVEPAEIELALLAHERVTEAIVISHPAPNGEERLVAYLVVDPNSPPSAGDIRSLLIKTLPEHMIPSAFVFLPALPRLPFGKIDRRALPAPAWGRPDLANPYFPPANATQLRLALLWDSVLGFHSSNGFPIVGAQDNFFELGGHSLAIAQLAVRTRETFSIDIPLRDFFEHPVLADMAALIDRGNTQIQPVDPTAELQRKLRMVG
jgi:hypothetical protein